jgi:hypothetical protein
MNRPLYPRGKRPWYPLDRRLGGPHSRSGRSPNFVLVSKLLPNLRILIRGFLRANHPVHFVTLNNETRGYINLVDDVWDRLPFSHGKGVT